MSPLAIIKPYFAENRFKIAHRPAEPDRRRRAAAHRPAGHQVGGRRPHGHARRQPAGCCYYAGAIAGIAVLIGAFRYVWRAVPAGHLPPRGGGAAQPPLQPPADPFGRLFRPHPHRATSWPTPPTTSSRSAWRPAWAWWP
ncbi:MAG: hypothetical protein MZV70_60505 [Desulfobacterales bacterium]|nr:hypothetical protein [Desulfobacterales bacterium]